LDRAASSIISNTILVNSKPVSLDHSLALPSSLLVKILLPSLNNVKNTWRENIERGGA
jgi:hypothetical protein